VLEAAVKRGA